MLYPDFATVNRWPSTRYGNASMLSKQFRQYTTVCSRSLCLSCLSMAGKMRKPTTQNSVLVAPHDLQP
ncbi:MAG: hypothetical protein WAU84_10570, partial [Thermoguttaceae bacterium]